MYFHSGLYTCVCFQTEYENQGYTFTLLDKLLAIFNGLSLMKKQVIVTCVTKSY